MIKSTRAILVWLCLLVSFMTAFVSIGYARVLDTLVIDASAQYQEEPALVYIQEVSYVSDSGDSNVTGDDPEFTKVGSFLPTIQHNNFTLKYQQNGLAGGSVTFEVTVRNNSGVDQYFGGYTTDPALPTKHKIEYTGIKLGDVLKHNTSVTFQIMVQNLGTKRSDGDIAFKNRIGTVKFSPDYSEMTETVTKGVAEKFGEVLNGKATINYNNKNYTGTAVVDLIINNTSESPTGNYIGNVGNADETKQAVMKAIFGEDLTMNIGNTTYNVWFLIKRQEVDGKNTNNENNHDMVLYVTADPLEQGGPDNNRKYVAVYAIVYTYNSGAGDKYIQCEHLFAGEAPVCDWGGSFGNNLTGNFHTHYWRSTEYDVSDRDTGNNQDGELDEAYTAYLNTLK